MEILQGGGRVTDKEYMQQILRIDDRIDCGDLSGIVAGIEQCVELQRKEIERLKGIKAEVRWVISQVRPNELAVLLTERYVQGKSWKELAGILFYSEARVRGELHDRALVEVGRIRARLK